VDKSQVEHQKCKGGVDLWNLHVDPLASSGDTLDIDIVVSRVVPLPIPERVFPREGPPDNQRDDTADEETPRNGSMALQKGRKSLACIWPTTRTERRSFR